MTLPSRPLRLAALALAGAMALTACSGDDGDSSAEPTPGVIDLSDSPSADVPDDLADATQGPDDSPTGQPDPTDGSAPERGGDEDPDGDVVGDLDPQVARQVPDLCKVFTDRHFRQVFGLPAEGAAASPVALAPVYSSCVYAGPNDAPALVLTAYKEDDVDDVMDDLDDRDDADLPLDDAEWSPRTGVLVEIDDTDWVLQVRATDARDRADRGRSLEVARSMVGRL